MCWMFILIMFVSAFHATVSLISIAKCTNCCNIWPIHSSFIVANHERRVCLMLVDKVSLKHWCLYMCKQWQWFLLFWPCLRFRGENWVLTCLECCLWWRKPVDSGCVYRFVTKTAVLNVFVTLDLKSSNKAISFDIVTGKNQGKTEMWLSLEKLPWLIKMFCFYEHETSVCLFETRQ